MQDAGGQATDIADWQTLQGRLRARGERRPVLLEGPRTDALIWLRQRLPMLLADRGTAQGVWTGPPADSPHERLNPVSPPKARQWLGRELDAVVWDGWNGNPPDSLAVLAGTLRAGGLLFWLMPPLAQWRHFEDPDYARTGLKDAPEHPFAAQMASELERNPSVIRVDLTRPGRVRLPLPDLPQESFKVIQTPDQQRAIEAIVRTGRGRRRRPLVITADRGRGKSAALGMAAVALLQQGRQHVVVTAPSAKAVETLFRHARLAAGEALAENTSEDATLDEGFFAAPVLYDLDNDGDGLPDDKDKCPNDPETKNGYQDEDGCPDELPEEVAKFAGVIEGMRFGKVHVGWFGNKSAMEAVDRAGGEVFVQTSKSDGSNGYYSHIITQADNDKLNSLEDLLKCDGSLNFGIGDPNSTSGFLVPSYYVFAQNGADPKECFKTVRNANHETNLMATANAQVDAAANNSEQLARTQMNKPEITDKVKVIWTSPLIPSDPMVYRKDLSREMKSEIKAFFLGYGRFGDVESAKEVLANNSDGMGLFMESSNAQLYPIRQLALFKDKLKIQNTEELSDEEKAKRVAEIDEKLAELDILVSYQ